MSDRPPGLDAAGIVAAVVRPEVCALSAYTTASAEGMIKLDAMENPFPLPDAVRGRVNAALAQVAINRYPDIAADRVKRALSLAFGIPDSLGLMLGNGSDELIQLITVALARPGAAMLAPVPSFVMYRLNAIHVGMRFVAVPLTSDFALDRDAMLAAVEQERPALTFLAYPNNPTGNLFAADDVAAIVRASPGLVVVDEAYAAFADESFLPRIAEFPNLLVLRTLSKVGMAGIRLGYAIAAPEWIAQLNKLRPPYNVNAFTQAAAVALLADAGWMNDQAATIRAERSRLAAALARLPGVTVFETQTNFLLARVPEADRMYDGLKQRRILVKNVHSWHPLLANCLRITVGTPRENEAFLAALTGLVPGR
jgi:histidinol-phosphate aminotransferase